MHLLFLIIFIVSSTIHLYASLKKNVKLRARTKGFIVSSLIGYYIFSVSSINIFVVLALLFSWLGDVFLIFKGNKYFSIGGISFGISHLLFIACYTKYIDPHALSPLFVILVVCVYLAAALIIFKRLKPHLPENLYTPMFIYFLINAANNIFACMMAMSYPHTGAIVCFIGAVLFFISDASLFFVRFKKDSLLKTHFIVMLTYILAEFLILYGLILLSA